MTFWQKFIVFKTRRFSQQDLDLRLTFRFLITTDFQPILRMKGPWRMSEYRRLRLSLAKLCCSAVWGVSGNPSPYDHGTMTCL